jgi:hypothetical protein
MSKLESSNREKLLTTICTKKEIKFNLAATLIQIQQSHLNRLLGCLTMFFGCTIIIFVD